MKLSDYQARAFETALPTALTPDYLAPMIVGEVGELFGALAKSVRDGWDEERTKQTLTKEYGDICWGVAVFLALHEVSEVEDLDPVVSHRGFVELMRCATALMDKDSGFSNVYNAEFLWELLKKLCEEITGSTFDQVLEANLSKLADRKQRGVIGGSGDER